MLCRGMWEADLYCSEFFIRVWCFIAALKFDLSPVGLNLLGGCLKSTESHFINFTLKPRYFYVTEEVVNILDTYPLLSVRLTLSDRHYTLSTFQDGSPKLNKPSETLSKYWDQLRDESWCAKLSYWHDFQDIVWAKYFPPLHRSWGWLLAPLSCLPAKFGAFSWGPPQGPIHLYLSFLSEQMKLESFNNITPLCH